MLACWLTHKFCYFVVELELNLFIVGMLITTNKKAKNIWRDTVPTAKLTFRISRDQL